MESVTLSAILPGLRWLAGTQRVAPLAFVKSSSIHMELTTWYGPPGAVGCPQSVCRPCSPLPGSGSCPLSECQLERPLQDVKDRRQQRWLQVHGVEDRPLVDQVGEAAHAVHLGDLSTGFVALAGEYLVKSVAQFDKPVGRDDVIQYDVSVCVQRAVLRGCQRLGDEPPFQQFAVHSG